jgi:hypothetical protein
MPITAGAIDPGQPVDRSAFGLSIQKDQLAMAATGNALGMGRRSVQDPSVQFSHPPALSGAQFQGGANPKNQVTFGGQPQGAA